MEYPVISDDAAFEDFVVILSNWSGTKAALNSSI